MFVIPIETTDHETDSLIIVLRPNSLQRMREADPATINLNQFHDAVLVNPRILIAYEEDDKIEQVVQSGDFGAMVEYLTRGYKTIGNDGDMPELVASNVVEKAEYAELMQRISTEETPDGQSGGLREP